jgi:ketosteroid isomerase-like protein
MADYDRAEIELAYERFVAAGDAQDWDAWTDLHTEDGVWVEHHLGTFRGREAIRAGIERAMAAAPPMLFPVEWHVIEGRRVVYYPWQVFPDPTGGDAVYRFGCVTILEYAGDGQWSYQEDLYNPNEATEVIQRWLKAGGQLPSPSSPSAS